MTPWKSSWQECFTFITGLGMKEYLFSYGTLQQEAVQQQLFERKLAGSPDSLRGYKTVPIELKEEPFTSEEATIYLIAVHTSDPNDRIDGILFELQEEEVLQADRYEPEAYKRVQVMLESGREAWVYAAFSQEQAGIRNNEDHS